MLWRAATQVQVGTDPRWSVALGDLSPAAVLALTGAPSGADVRLLRTRMLEAGASTEELGAVVERLLQVGLLTARATDPPATPDHLARALMTVDGDGAAVLARRSRARVCVDGLGRTGAAVAVGLAAAGVGTVRCVDGGVTSPGDVGAGPLLPGDVGRRRVDATADAVRRAAPGTRTEARGRTDLVVLVERLATDPTRHRSLLLDDVPHLSVVVREASVLVGPLVRPGSDPCLRCADLHRADADDRWPALGPQLVATERAVLAGEETAAVAVASGLAVAAALAHVDGRPAALTGASLEVRVPDAVPSRTTWTHHDDCGCRDPVPVRSPSPSPDDSRVQPGRLPVADAGGDDDAPVMRPPFGVHSETWHRTPRR